ncbi:MAG: hypothetical protein MRJ68_17655 [Nitrospira sp.]|nr:hypothetical protein [Nitrospira sp.]
MAMNLNQLVLTSGEWSPADVAQAAAARWSCDLDLHDRFLTLTDYLQQLQLMRLGLVPVDATLLP